VEAPVVAYLESRAGEALGKLIARLGAVPMHAPALAEQPDADAAQLVAWLEEWEQAAEPLAIFQTGVGVEALDAAFASLGMQTRFLAVLAGSTVAVRGPKPSAALRKRGVRIDLSAESPFTTETLLHALAGTAMAGRAVFVQRHGGPNAALVDAMAHAGARCREVTTYRWTLPSDRAPLDQLLAALRAGRVSAVVFTSASQLVNLLTHATQYGRNDECVAGLNRTEVFSVGPVCSEALADAGVRVAAEASPPKLGPLVELLRIRLGQRGLLPDESPAARSRL